MSLRIHALWAAPLVLAALSGPTAAQCPMPDFLDGGPCCTQAQANLPFFPGFGIESMQICWQDCDVDATIDCRAQFSFLKPLLVGNHCARYRARLRLFDTAGNLKWKGKLFLTYSRTWFESDGGVQRLQVWRFLVNSNLRPLTSVTPCPVPTCAAAFGNRVRFTGYIDYAVDCSTGDFSHAWMLNHACDSVDHAPGFPRGGAFHPDRDYTFVGPSTSFAVSPTVPGEGGGGPTEAVRRALIPFPGQPDTVCFFEEGLDHNLSPLSNFCLCGIPGSPLQWQLSDLILATFCGTGATTPGGPLLPGMLSMGLGTWTDPLTYPGTERLRYSAGNYDYFDACTGATRNEVFFGVSTLGGYAATSIINTGFGGPLPLTFMDQANSIHRGNGVTTVMNVPFASDHILNLNH